MLAHVHIGKTMLAAARLNLKEGKQGAHLFFHRAEPNQVVEFLLNFAKRTRWADPSRRAGATAPFCDEIFGVALGKIASFEQAFKDVVRACDVLTLAEAVRPLAQVRPSENRSAVEQKRLKHRASSEDHGNVNSR